jgi:hypothetical protein
MKATPLRHITVRIREAQNAMSSMAPVARSYPLGDHS